MPLVTANQFDLVPQFSNIGTGAAQGYALGSQFKQRQQQEQQLAAQQAQKQQISQFTPQALAGDKEALGKIAGIDSDLALNLQKLMASQDEATNKEMLRENENMTRGALSVLDISGGDPAKARVALQNLEKQWSEQGLSTDLTKGALALDDVGMMRAIKDQASKGLEIDQYAKSVLGVDQAKDPVGTASQRDFRTYLDLVKSDPSKAEMFGRQAGFIRLTEEEKADIKVSEAERKEIAKSNVTRKQGYIDSGIDAADSAGNIKKSLELLKTVKTGGFDNVALSVKRLFGVEGADEAELSTNLGKNVLAQLKPIFGAAFTASEGDKLEKIEAGFGKSTEGNIRLLENAMGIVERAAKRGLAAAEDQNDEFTANEIRTLLASMKEVEENKGESSSIDDLVNKYAN